eukprot:2199330-Rhodomonas_salina.8
MNGAGTSCSPMLRPTYTVLTRSPRRAKSDWKRCSSHICQTSASIVSASETYCTAMPSLLACAVATCRKNSKPCCRMCKSWFFSGTVRKSEGVLRCRRRVSCWNTMLTPAESARRRGQSQVDAML